MAAMTERFEHVSIDKLIGYARNARTHPKEQIQQLRASLREFGFVNPALIDKDCNIIAGHGRILAAREEGIDTIPCVFVEHLTEAQKRAYIIADNRLSLNAGWDNEMLSVELSDLQGADFDMSVLGFDDTELAKLLDTGGDAKDDDFDLTAALEQAAFVLPGDIWTLGRHRLLCGDATKPEDVNRLMAGRKANLALTDIPYGVNYRSASGLSIMNDNLKGDAYFAFLLAAFGNMATAMENDGSIYVFHADTEGLTTRRAFDAAGFYLSGTCIWTKNTFVMGRSPYQWQHEPILYGWIKTGKHKWYADRKQSTIWRFDKPSRNQDHPNAKPIDLLSYPIQNSTQTNAIVLDMFGGSGATLIACEQLDRECRMMELDPKYASVILRRYATLKQNNGDDITCERGRETLRYADLAKEVERA